MTYYDALETRSADERAADQAQALRAEQIARALSFCPRFCGSSGRRGYGCGEHS